MKYAFAVCVHAPNCINTSEPYAKEFGDRMWHDVASEVLQTLPLRKSSYNKKTATKCPCAHDLCPWTNKSGPGTSATPIGHVIVRTPQPDSAQIPSRISTKQRMRAIACMLTFNGRRSCPTTYWREGRAGPSPPALSRNRPHRTASDSSPSTRQDAARPREKPSRPFPSGRHHHT